MRRLIILTLIAFLAAFRLDAQTSSQTTPPEPPLDPDQVAEQWIDRLNALDDWFLSVEGEEEGIDQVVDSMMELFAADALAEVPPYDEDQIGPVRLNGGEQVRKWLYRLARTQVRFTYQIPARTVGFAEAVHVVHSTPLPWGDLGVSFQIIGVYSLRDDRFQRFVAPGAVFMELREDSKIQRLRMYLAEITPVTPL